MQILKAKQPVKIIIDHFCDGDTLVAQVECPCCGIICKRSIRLVGIDSYEPYGEEKMKANMIADKLNAIYVGWTAELIPKQSGSDKYGRIVGYVRIDNKDLATELVNRGFAWYVQVKHNRIIKHEDHIR